MRYTRTYGLIVGILCLFLLTPVSAMATSASISASGNEGKVPVNASATFTPYETCDNADPPNCTVCDRGTLSAYLDDTRQCMDTGNGSASCSFDVYAAFLPNGMHTVTANATDCMGVTATNSDKIKVDNTPTLTASGPGSVSGEFTINGSVQFKDCTGCSNAGFVYLSINDPAGNRHRYKKFSFTNTNGNWSEKYLGHTWANGTYTYEIVAQAGGNNARSETISGQIKIDNTPVLEVEELGDISGEFLLSGTAEFKECPNCTSTGSVIISIYGPAGNRHRFNPIGFKNTSEKWSQKYLGHTWPDGTYTYEIYAQAGGNFARSETISGQIKIDNTPILKVEKPDDLSGKFSLSGTVEFKKCPGCTSTGSVFIRINDSDGNQYRSNQIGFNKTSANWSQTYLGHTWANGTYTYEVVAQAGGNYARSDTVSGQITIDNTPVVSVEEPGDISGSFSLSGSAKFKECPECFLTGYLYINIYSPDGTLYRHDIFPFKDTDESWTKLYQGYSWPNGSYKYEVYGKAVGNGSNPAVRCKVRRN